MDLKQELQSILLTMDIPENRLNDLLWLSRNIFIRNRKHKQFNRAIELINTLLRSS